MGVRSGLSVAGDPHQDDSPIALTQGVKAQTPALQRAGAEVLHDDVGLVDELKEQLAAAFGTQVEGDGLLVAGVHGPEEVVPVEFGLSPGAQRIGFAGQLDLDDLGAHVAEQSPGERPGDQRAELQNPDAVQRTSGVHADEPTKSCSVSQSLTIDTACRSASR